MAKLTTRQAAEKLGISIRRVNALIQSGQLRAEKFGPINMIDEDDLKLVEDRKPGRPPKTKVEPASLTRKKKVKCKE
jgi:excisionase family DNA binding protein